MEKNGGAMTTALLKKMMTGIFLLVVFGYLAYQKQHKPRLFILHSFHQNMPWVQSANRGVARIFSNKPYIDIRYFYMNTKRKHSETHIRRISKSALSSIQAWKPDVLIAFDYDAQKLLKDHENEFKNSKIIMAGVADHQLLKQSSRQNNFSAISEEIPVKAIREVLSIVFRQQRRIYYLSDNSDTAKALEHEMLKKDWGSFSLVEHRRVNTVAEWKQAVREANEKADVLLVSVYHGLKKDKQDASKPTELVQWMNQHSNIPVVGMFESFMLEGGLMAIAISSVEQGYAASWLAFQMLESNLETAELPVVQGKNFSLYINKKELKKRFPDARLPVILNTFSKTA